MASTAHGAIMSAILLMVVFMGNQGLHQIITIPVITVDFCEKNKQSFIDSATLDHSMVIVRKSTCLGIHP